MIKVLKDVIEHAKKWSSEDQEKLLEVARAIDAGRRAIYVMSDEERAGVEEGLAQADRGEFVSAKKMRAFWKKHGVT